MPYLSDLSLLPSVNAILAPLIGDKQVGAREDGVWIEKGRLRMELGNIGEGLHGDYNKQDPTDIPLLRFTFFIINPAPDQLDGSPGAVRLDELDGGSYCTGIAATAPWEVQLACACAIFDEIFAKLSLPLDLGAEIDPYVGRDGARVFERMSLTFSTGFQALHAAIQADALSHAAPLAQGQSRPPRM